MSPYAHPMVPLLLDMECAAEAMPDIRLPLVTKYPGGEERARWHLQEGLAVFERHFGFKPAGCWPSEGGLSIPTLGLLAEHGFQWCASGETVLRNSIQRNEMHDEHPCRHRVYRFGGQPINCFFRDDGLSDLIGFSYADWHAADAVNNLVHHLEQVAESCPNRKDCAVAIILDGENAWEYYPENAYHFLSGLYQTLAKHPVLKMSTFSKFLEGRPDHVELPNMVSGSWVYGNFSTWVGSSDKNRGWDMLAEAKQHYDEVLASGSLNEHSLQRAQMHLSACEGSDWFWWFGDHNPADSVSDFDRLYRQQLKNLYQMLGEEAPSNLDRPISIGGGNAENSGTMRRGHG
jgi:alpha-amylase/alpha-mannosidase (GH57 family)